MNQQPTDLAVNQQSFFPLLAADSLVNYGRYNGIEIEDGDIQQADTITFPMGGGQFGHKNHVLVLFPTQYGNTENIFKKSPDWPLILTSFEGQASELYLSNLTTKILGIKIKKPAMLDSEAVYEAIKAMCVGAPSQAAHKAFIHKTRKSYLGLVDYESCYSHMRIDFFTDFPILNSAVLRTIKYNVSGSDIFRNGLKIAHKLNNEG